jgi:hypothetical protein
MKNVKLSTRILTLLIIVLGIAGIYFWQNGLAAPTKITAEISGVINKISHGNQAAAPIAEKTPGGLNNSSTENISITINKQGLIPFDLLEIAGKNLDPDAATSVIFTNREEENLTIPALSVTASSVAVAVPPLNYNKATGKFNYDVVSFKVVQIKKDGTKLTVKSSNEISGILIGAPATPSVLKRADAKNMPAGTITRAFVAIAVQSLQDAASQTPASSTKVKASLVAEEKGMEDLLSALDKYIKNPKTAIKVPSSGGTINLDAAGVAWLDAFYSGFLGLAEERVLAAAEPAPHAFISAANAAGTDCQIDSGPEASATTILAQEAGCLRAKILDSDTEVKVRGLYDRLNFSNNMWIIAGSLTLALVTDGLSVEAQIACSIVYSITTSYMKDGKMPDVDSLPGFWATAIGGYLDKMTGVPICDYLSNSIDIFKEMCQDLQSKLCRQVDAVVSWPGKMLLYLRDGQGDALKMPDNNLVRVLDGIGSPEGGYDLVKTGPVKTPGKAPVKIVPIYSPPPKYVPPPPPPVPGCEQKKQTAYNQCAANCGSDPDISTYNQCLTGCDSVHDLIDKSNCSNTCIGAWQKTNSDHSHCFAACLNAENATVCP